MRLFNHACKLLIYTTRYSNCVYSQRTNYCRRMLKSFFKQPLIKCSLVILTNVYITGIIQIFFLDFQTQDELDENEPSNTGKLMIIAVKLLF